MSISIKTNNGQILISHEVIASIVGLSTMECYGVVGMASTKRLKDGVAELLKMENYDKGIVIRESEDGIAIDVHIIVSYGVKISEVAANVQQKVKFSLQQIVGVDVNEVNILIEDVKVVK